LVAASPEQFLCVRADGTLSTSPIKGTRPRGHDGPSDAHSAAELARDPKERAENLMIVDLMRNDLSRVCLPGSVGVTRLFDVEKHAHVHQLVSEVTGIVRPGCGTPEIIDAVFAAGSMT